MTCGVYQILCSANRRRYVGSAFHVEKRWIQHKSDLKCGRHKNAKLQNTWNKYGAECFKMSVLEISSVRSLRRVEQFWINKHRPWFNLTPASTSMLGFKHSEETKRILSIKCRGRIVPPEERAAISARMMGNTYGRAHKGREAPWSKRK